MFRFAVFQENDRRYPSAPAKRSLSVSVQPLSHRHAKQRLEIRSFCVEMGVTSGLEFKISVDLVDTPTSLLSRRLKYNDCALY